MRTSTINIVTAWVRAAAAAAAAGPLFGLLFGAICFYAAFATANEVYFVTLPKELTTAVFGVGGLLAVIASARMYINRNR